MPFTPPASPKWIQEESKEDQAVSECSPLVSIHCVGDFHFFTIIGEQIYKIEVSHESLEPNLFILFTLHLVHDFVGVQYTDDEDDDVEEQALEIGNTHNSPGRTSTFFGTPQCPARFHGIGDFRFCTVIGNQIYEIEVNNESSRSDLLTIITMHMVRSFAEMIVSCDEDFSSEPDEGCPFSSSSIGTHS